MSFSTKLRNKETLQMEQHLIQQPLETIGILFISLCFITAFITEMIDSTKQKRLEKKYSQQQVFNYVIYMSKLTVKQEKFIAEYIKNGGNATQAYRDNNHLKQ